MQFQRAVTGGGYGGWREFEFANRVDRGMAEAAGSKSNAGGTFGDSSFPRQSARGPDPRHQPGWLVRLLGFPAEARRQRAR